MKKKRKAYYTGFQNKKHPELRDGEFWIQNASYRGFKEMQKTLPHKVQPLRLGRVAYTPQGKVVPKYRPVFGRATKEKR
jgi:hypothetical protein